MLIKTKDLFGFVNESEKFICGLEFKTILKRNINDIALFRVSAGAGAIAYDGNTELMIYLGVFLVLILLMTIELLYRKDYYKK